LYKRLLLLNGLATLTVPFYHAAAEGLATMFQKTNAYLPVVTPNYDALGTPVYFITIFIRQLVGFAIPAFLLVSGFFVAFSSRSAQGTLSWKIVFSRIRQLLPPFLIWTAISFALQLKWPENLSSIFRPYYYIPLVIQLYLLSPLILPLARRRPVLLLVLASAFLLIDYTTNYAAVLTNSPAWVKQLERLMPIWLFPARSLYYVLGMLLGLNIERAGAWLVRRRRWLLGGAFVTAILTCVEYVLVDYYSSLIWIGSNFSGLSRVVFSILFVLAILADDRLLTRFQMQLNEIGVRSLGVYLMNSPAIYILASLMYHFTPQWLGNQFLYQTILVAFGLGLPLAGMWLVRKSPLRPAYRLLFG